MKKILFICFALIFVLILVSCDISGDVSNTSNSSDSLEAQTPLPNTTTTGKNEEPSSPIPPENIGNTTSNNDVVLDPTKPSREDAQKIELYMTLTEVENFLSAEGIKKMSSSGLYDIYTWKLSDGSVLTIYFERPKHVDDPEQYVAGDADRIVTCASIGEDWHLYSADCIIYHGINFIGKTYNDIVDMIGEPYKKTNDNGTLLCSWIVIRSSNLVICFDENMIAEDILFDVTHISIISMDERLKIGTELSALLTPYNVGKENEYKYITLSEPEYDPETKLTLYKWSIWFYGGDLLIWFDEEQKIEKFKSDWIYPKCANKIGSDMTYSEVIDIIGEPNHITEDGTYQWKIAERYKTLSVKFAENADGILVVSEVKQD